MNTCADCTHKHNGEKTEWSSLCVLFPHIVKSGVTGENEPPYKRCVDVRKVHVANPTADECDLFDRKAAAPEALVKQSPGVKSVTFAKNAAGH